MGRLGSSDFEKAPFNQYLCATNANANPAVIGGMFP